MGAGAAGVLGFAFWLVVGLVDFCLVCAIKPAEAIASKSSIAPCLSRRFCFSSRSTRDESAARSLFSLTFSSTGSLGILAALHPRKSESFSACQLRGTPRNRLVYSQPPVDVHPNARDFAYAIEPTLVGLKIGAPGPRSFKVGYAKVRYAWERDKMTARPLTG